MLILAIDGAELVGGDALIGGMFEGGNENH